MSSNLSFKTRVLCLAVACCLASLFSAAGDADTSAPPPDAFPDATELERLLVEDRWREVLDALKPVADEISTTDLRGLHGEALLRAGRIREARGVLEPLVEQTDAPATAIVALARIRAASGRHEEAAELINRAAETAPDDPRVLFWCADLEQDRGVAIRRLERYLEFEGTDPDRVESVKGSLRTLRALGDREIWIPGAMPDRVELPLQRLLASNGVLLGYAVRVTLGSGGKPVRLLLDTGAGGLFVVRRVAKKRGFIPLAEETLFGGGGDRRHPTQRGLFPSIDIGGLVFENTLVSVHDQEFEPTGRYHGLLGLSVFRGYRVTLDLDQRTLLLEKGARLEHGAPYYVFSNQLLIPGRLGPESEGLFLADTGAARTLLDRSAVERVGEKSVGGPARVRGFGGAVEGAQIVSGVEVGFGDWVHSGDFWSVDLSVRNRMGGVQLSGFLGLDFWDRSRIVIDTIQQRVDLTRDR